jgi:hypothetical protein
MEGNAPCPDPAICEHGSAARAHVENYRGWLNAQRPAVEF